MRAHDVGCTGDDTEVYRIPFGINAIGMRQGQFHNLIAHPRNVLVPGLIGPIGGDGGFPSTRLHDEIHLAVDGFRGIRRDRGIGVARRGQIQSPLQHQVHHTVDGPRLLVTTVEHRLRHHRRRGSIGDVVHRHRGLRVHRPPRAPRHPHHRRHGAVPAVARLGDHRQSVAGQELADDVSGQRRLVGDCQVGTDDLQLPVMCDVEVLAVGFDEVRLVDTVDLSVGSRGDPGAGEDTVHLEVVVVRPRSAVAVHRDGLTEEAAVLLHGQAQQIIAQFRVGVVRTGGRRGALAGCLSGVERGEQVDQRPADQKQCALQQFTDRIGGQP